MFKPATKTQSRLRLALIGPSGSGKTYSALSIAQGLAPGGRVAVLDTERGSAAKYADAFSFDTATLDSFHPLKFVEAIKAAESAHYDVLIIDSLSHAWMGKDGALEQVDKAAARMRSPNSFAAWKDVTPMQMALVDAMLQSRCHIIATVRSKTEWVLEQDSKGKTMPRKVGLAPVQRDGLEFEFDVVGDMDQATLVVTKTRCKALHQAVVKEPGAELGATLKAWLTDGAPLMTPPAVVPAAAPAPVGAPAPSPVKAVPPPPSEPTAGEQVYIAVSEAQSIDDLKRLVPSIKKLPRSEQDAIRGAYNDKRKALSHLAAAAQGVPR